MCFAGAALPMNRPLSSLTLSEVTFISYFKRYSEGGGVHFSPRRKTQMRELGINMKIIKNTYLETKGGQIQTD
jgi:hypothetical protein